MLDRFPSVELNDGLLGKSSVWRGSVVGRRVSLET